MKRVVIVPVAHISKVSVKTVNACVNTVLPEVVCVELCASRYVSLMSRKRSMLPSLNPLHLIMFYFQRMLGWAADIEPGSEMKSAIVAAKSRKIKIALIDMPIQLIMKGLSKVPLSEWVHALFTKERIDINISSAMKKGDIMYALSPGAIDDVVEKFKKHMPTVYEIMIGRRDSYMGSNIIKLLENNDIILCVIGAGHVPGIWKLLIQTYKNKIVVDVLWPK